MVAGYSDRTGTRLPSRDPGLDRLSQREREVLAGLGRGMTNTEIAAQLVVSLPTVTSHVVSVLAKLGLRDRTQAAISAHRNGLAT